MQQKRIIQLILRQNSRTTHTNSSIMQSDKWSVGAVQRGVLVLLVLGVTGLDPTLCMCCDVFIILTLQRRGSSCIDHVISQYYKLSARNNTGKFCSFTRHEGVRGSRCILHSFLTSVLVLDEWSVSRSRRFISSERAPRQGGLQRRSERFWEEIHLQLLMGFEPRTVQLVYQ